MTRSAPSDREPASGADVDLEQERESVVAPRPRWVALFCEERGQQTERAVQLLGAGLRAGDKVVAIADTSCLQTMLSRFAVGGHAVDRLLHEGQLTLVDSQELLSDLNPDDELAAHVSWGSVATLVADQLAELGAGRLLHAYNELPALLWERGQRVAAIEAEALWEELSRIHGQRLRAHHAIAGFFKSSTTEPNVAAGLPSSRELERRAQIDDALREALRSSRVKLTALRGSEQQLRDRQRAEDQLRTSEQRLQRIADALPVLISFVDSDLRYQFVNATYERWFGLRRADIVGKHVKDVLGADAFARAAPHLASALAGSVSSYEAELPYLHGGARSVQATYLPDFDPNSGKVSGYIGLVSDISERTRLETLRAAAALRAEKLYEEAVDARSRAEQLYHFAQAVVEADRIEVVLDAAFVAIERALGTSRAAFLRADADGVMRFKAWRGLSDAYRAAVEGHNPWAPDDPAPAPVLVSDARKDASLAPFAALFEREKIGALAFVPLVSDGRLLGKFMLYYDAPHAFTRAHIETARAIANHLASVTVRYETVAALEETIRNNELLAGVLAHDLRNPLAAILTAAHLVLTNDAEEGVSAGNVKAIGKILSSGGRMKAMIEQLLDFTRARSGGGIGIDPERANLAELAAQALDELELTHPSWRIDRRVVGDPVGYWDPDRVLQVVSNLASNAGQHGRTGGTIRVTVDGTEAHHVLLVVHNDGAVAALDPQELFNPFRSSPRSRSRGLGLGLFIVREIVKAHGGSVDVVSSELDGTTFVARFPRAAN